MEAFLERLHGDGGDIGTQQGSLDHMVGRAHRGGDDLDHAVRVLAGPIVVLDASDHVRELRDAIQRDIVVATNELRDVAGAGVGGQQRLSRGEDERHIHANALIGQNSACCQTGLADGQLYDDIRSERGEPSSIGHHAIDRRRRGLSRHRQALAELGDLLHVGLEVGEGAARLGVQARIGGDAGQAPPALRLGDLFQVRGIDEELQGRPFLTLCHRASIRTEPQGAASGG